MNIKFVYKNNLHKAPHNVKTLTALQAAVQVIYPIQPSFVLCTPEGQLIEINNESEFQSLIADFQKEGRSIKFQVHDENEHAPMSQEDFLLLNESLFSQKTRSKQPSKIQVIQQDQLSNDQFQNPQQLNDLKLTKETKSTDSDTDTMPKKQEQNQNQNLSQNNEFLLKELLQSKELQKYLDKYFEDRLEKSGIIDEIKAVRMQQDFLIQGLQTIEQWKQTSSLTLNQIRTQQEQSQESKLYHSEQLVSQQMPIIMRPGELFEWKVHIKNSGEKSWPNSVHIKCLNGPYCGVSEPIYSTQPKQVSKYQIPLEAIHLPGIYYSIWRLCFTLNDKEYFFGQELSFQLNVVETDEIFDKRFINTAILTKAKLVKLTLKDESLDKLCCFIEQQNLHYQAPEKIIESYVQTVNNSRQQQYQYPPPPFEYHKPQQSLFQKIFDRKQ